jgi:hypothetical protein
LGTSGSKWVLYNGNPTSGGTKIDSNLTGNFSVTPTATTTYYLRAEDSLPCSRFTAAVSALVTVVDSSLKQTSFTANPNPICKRDSVTLTVNGGTLGTNGKWVIYSAKPFIASNILTKDTNRVHKFAPLVTTTYYVRAEDTIPCSKNLPEDSVVVTVRDTSTAPSSLTASPDTICSGNSTTLTVVGTLGASSSNWQLYNGNPLSGGTLVATNKTGIFTVSPTSTTTYYARAQDSLPCTTVTAAVSRQVVVKDTSIAPTSINVNPASICLGDPTTITVVGGTLVSGSVWALYNGNPLSGGTLITSNTSGIFNHAPSDTITYYVRAEDPAPCNKVTPAVFATVDVVDCVCSGSGVVEYAPSSVLPDTTTVASIECFDPVTGWTYYSTPAKPDTFLFAIMKNPLPIGNTNPFTAEVLISVANSPTNPSSVYTSGAPYINPPLACNETFVMPRYWNVDVTSGVLNGPVKTRFYFPAAEEAATRARANAFVAANIGTCPGLHAGPSMMFKNNDGTFFNTSTDIQYYTINNTAYEGDLKSNYPQGIETGKEYVECTWTGFSGGGLSISVSLDTAVLPVTLLYFTGTPINNEVLLNWKTASEFNNDKFIVERSSDAVQWYNIGEVKGNGTTSLPHEYNLLDKNPIKGTNYYRLRQVDFDGQFEYSRIILINFDANIEQTGFVGVYPNPTDGMTKASIMSLKDQQVILKIFDASGRMVENANVTLGKGMNTVDINLINRAVGVYMVSFTDKDGTEYQTKIVKQ